MADSNSRVRHPFQEARVGQFVQDVCVIIPTIREYQILSAYLENGRKHGFDVGRLHVLFVTEDFCDIAGMEALLAKEGVPGAVFHGTARKAWFQERGLEAFADLIPARSHAETSFGLLYMLDNPDFDYGVFIDDDTLPEEGHDYWGLHMQNLHAEGDVETRSSSSKWVNVLSDSGKRIYPRGYPYGCMDETQESRMAPAGHVVCSQGLWTNVPDFDAVRILAEGDILGQSRTRLQESDFGPQFAVAKGDYLTVCSMNLAFRREVIPGFYQLPMDDNEWRVGRFDDIWSGVILKRIADHLSHNILNGAPLCIHNKAPRSSFKDLLAEAAGLELNEHFWEMLDAIPLTATDYAGAMDELAQGLLAADVSAYVNHPFIPFMAEKMARWVECCRRLESTA